MKIKVTNKSKRFIESLNSADKAKFIITEETIESSDDEMLKRWEDYLVADFKSKMHEIGNRVQTINDAFQKEYPEYFEN